MSRDSLREQIFKAKVRKSELVEFFGAPIEIRQPTLGDILEARDNGNSQSAIVGLLVSYAYVPGTDQKVFDAEDGEAIRALPFGPDFLRLNEAMERLTDVNFQQPNSGSGQAGA
jgi:hypothetical protein